MTVSSVSPSVRMRILAVFCLIFLVETKHLLVETIGDTDDSGDTTHTDDIGDTEDNTGNLSGGDYAEVEDELKTVSGEGISG